MTQEVLTPTPPYIVSGTGPYPITHGYPAGADVTAVVIVNEVRTELVFDTDFFVSPDGHETAGNVTLSAAAAANYDTGTLYIGRDIDLEQGWQAQGGAREVGLEAQLDGETMAIQDLRQMMSKTVRLDVPINVVGEKQSVLFGTDVNGDFAQIQLPADMPGNYLGFDAEFNPVALSAPTDTSITTIWSKTLLDDGNEFSGRDTLGVSDKVVEHTGDHTIGASDRGKVHVFTATGTLDAFSAATAKDGFSFRFHVQAGVLTVDPGAGLWNVETLHPGDFGFMYSDGVIWRIFTSLKQRSGIWTPIVTTSGGVDIRDMSGAHRGDWTRDGKRVHFDIRSFKMTVGTMGLWEYFTISGLPFAISATLGHNLVGTDGVFEAFTMAGTTLTGTIGGQAHGATSDLRITGSYLTDDA